MIPTKGISCVFFAQGVCRKGGACQYLHLQPTTRTFDEWRPEPSPATALQQPSVPAKSTKICTFFERGQCTKGEACRFLHPEQQSAPITRASLAEAFTGLSIQERTDSRSKVPCIHLARGFCRNGDICPYLHASGDQVVSNSGQTVDAREEKEDDQTDDFTRVFCGASVAFDDFGHVVKVSLPSDFSIAYLTGLDLGSTPFSVTGMLQRLGFNKVDPSCVRISPDMKATVKVEDPEFAQNLSNVLKERRTTIKATAILVATELSKCRKVYISWHKPSRTAKLEFDRASDAREVVAKFNQGMYRCLGQTVQSTLPRYIKPARTNHGRVISANQFSNVIISLSGLPKHAAAKDVSNAIKRKPRSIEMGPVNYPSSAAEVSVDVRSMLEKYGTVEKFYLSPDTNGKRVKATAWYENEMDAKSALALNDKSLDILGRGKLTITLVQSSKVKVSSAIYHIFKKDIDREREAWKTQHLSSHIYKDATSRLTTLKIDGEDEKAGENGPIWAPSLQTNGTLFKKLREVETKLDVIIQRDKSKRQLRCYGSPEACLKARCEITTMLKDESSTKNFEIPLKVPQFSWAIRGGFRQIQEALGQDIAIFNVVARKFIVNGTQHQYDAVLALLEGRHVTPLPWSSASISFAAGDCPICLCEADSPIQVSCEHTYCLECLEELAKSAAATSKEQFRIRCQGSEGTCPMAFSLNELHDHLPTSVFEDVLQSSFSEHLKRHPDSLKYCPTPDCGYVYRSKSISNPPAYRCPNCLESICTFCHDRHGKYTCAEYKDIKSGGYEALEKLKNELSIKDCPKCKTHIMKSGGCNHITCQGCKTHICWVCMAVFPASGPVYTHMNAVHRSIGLPDVEAFEFDYWGVR